MPLPLVRRVLLACLSALSLATAHASVQVTFQDGVSPDNTYAGTRDLRIDSDDAFVWDPNHNYNHTELQASGVTGDQQVFLVRFGNLPPPPAGQTLTAVTLRLYVTDGTADTYSLFALKKAFTESTVTWRSSPWVAPGGAQDTADRGTTVLGTTPANSTGVSMDIVLNAAGKNLVATWQNNNAANFGFILQNLTATDSFAVASSEDADTTRRPELILTYSDASTKAFQQGALPTTGYSTCTDVTLANGAPRNFDGARLGLDGLRTQTGISPNDKALLLSFDVSAIPPWSTVQSAQLTLFAPASTDFTTASYPIYEAKRTWDEATATFVNYDATHPWLQPGGNSTTDHGSTVLGSISSGTAGVNTTSPLVIDLNASGIALAQSWVTTPSSNLGLMSLDYGQGDGTTFADREDATAARHPKLVVTYLEGKLVFTAGTGQALDAGGISQAITVTRQRLSGTAIAAGAPALVVALATSSPRGQFSSGTNPAGTWTAPGASTAVTIPAGSASASIYYRDAQVGTATLTASVGPAWTGGSTSESFRSAILSETAESGVLVGAGGLWTQDRNDVSNVDTIATDAAAAHRGSLGIHHDDADPEVGAGGQRAVAFITAPFLGELHGRAWTRVSAVGSSLGNDAFVQLNSSGANGVRAQLSLSYPGANLVVAGYDQGGTFQTDAIGTPVPFATGAWRLVEWSLYGLGTTAGVRKVFVDGVQVSSRTGINWANGTNAVSELVLGEPWSDDRRFVGGMDFDDLRLSTLPQPSHLKLTGPAGNVGVNSCVAVTVSLRDSNAGALRDAPYALDAAATVGGVSGAFYSNSGCTTASPTVSFAAGAQTVTTWFKPTTAGTALLTASFVDLLPGSTSLTVVTGAPLTLSPASASVSPGGTVAFSASGGSGAGYLFSLPSNPSGGTITAGGAYTAGAGVNVTDTVQVQDSLGATATALVGVGKNLAISPSATSLAAGQGLDLTATGGTPPYAFALTTNASGGSLSAAHYTAGSAFNVTDVVTVTDNGGAQAQARIDVTSASASHVDISGPSSFTAGTPTAFTLQVVDGLGNVVAGAQGLTASLTPVAGASAAVGAVFSGSTLGATGGATSSGTSDSAGSATLTVEDVAAESIQLCARISSDLRSQQCRVITSAAGAPHHAKLFGPANPLPACTETQLQVGVVDVNDNVVEGQSTVSVCMPGTASVVIGSTTLSGESRAGACVTGDVGFNGLAALAVSDDLVETVAFSPSQGGLPGAGVGVSVSWTASTLSPLRTGFSFDPGVASASLSTGTGTVLARVTPRDTCNNPVALQASEVAIHGDEPLTATAAAASPAGGFVSTVELPGCPADPTVPLAVGATVGGQALVDVGGAPRTLAVQPQCRAPQIRSSPNLTAQCNQPYRYSSTGIPEVVGDGPFSFTVIDRDGKPLPEGFSLSPSGEIFWTPLETDPGVHHLSLVVTGAAGSATQDLDLTVTCGNGKGCGCGEGEAMLMLPALAAWALLRRRRPARR